MLASFSVLETLINGDMISEDDEWIDKLGFHWTSADEIVEAMNHYYSIVDNLDVAIYVAMYACSQTDVPGDPSYDVEDQTKI